MKRAIAAFMCILAVALASGVAEAKDDKGKAKGHDKIKVDKSNGPKVIPPGQIKRYTRGAKLPDDLRFDYIDDLDKWKLTPLPPGQRYIRIDDDIVSIYEDSRTVIDAVGIVSDLLK
ncbi:hypothetical protein [Ruegeria marina]|uniref:Nickel/cobalt transporter regulator n=1 Tax=Ruegeria marina TaxID=639004 RepID=A0A1G6J5M6_9RHOB|nr:hypothetical protein [Ruegeria marina]SDC14194.1 hypothetical protein SAMN04488239_101283 [Ruegeria marina]